MPGFPGRLSLDCSIQPDHPRYFLTEVYFPCCLTAFIALPAGPRLMERSTPLALMSSFRHILKYGTFSQCRRSRQMTNKVVMASMNPRLPLKTFFSGSISVAKLLLEGEYRFFGSTHPLFSRNLFFLCWLRGRPTRPVEFSISAPARDGWSRLRKATECVCPQPKDRRLCLADAAHGLA